MRTLKISLVIVFSLAALTPAISARVAALTATPAQGKSSKDKPDKNKDAAHSKQGQPVDASQYVGGESCAECHAAEATHYALTAHSKTKVGNAPVDKQSCEACHGPARGHDERMRAPYLETVKGTASNNANIITLVTSDGVSLLSHARGAQMALGIAIYLLSLVSAENKPSAE